MRFRVVGEHSRHELQVALVAPAGRDGLGQVERDVLGDDRARHVDDGGAAVTATVSVRLPICRRTATDVNRRQKLR